MGDPASLSPSERFNSLIEGLFDDVRTRATNPWCPVRPWELLLIKLIWRRLRRLSRRFAAILAQLRAGTLPTYAEGASVGGPPAGEAAEPPAVEARARASRETPAGTWRFGWVIHAVSWFVWNRHYELKEMLEEPEAEALVAEAPQLGRVLRPMCQMLAVKPPEWLRLPRRPRARRVKTIPPAPDWILNAANTVQRPDGSVWMHLGMSTHWKPGWELTLEQARKLDPPIRIWPRPK